MIVLLIELFHSFGIKIPAVFGYYSSRMMLAAITSLVVSIFFGPFFIRKLFELKIGQSIRKEECPVLGDLHANKKDTPTMGGILIIASMLVSMLLWMNPRHSFTLILLITTLFLGIVGGVDDYLKLKYKNARGLSARKKFGAQCILSLFIAFYLLYPPFTEAIHVGNWFAPPVVKEEPIVTKKSGEILQKRIPLHQYASRIYIPFLKEPLTGASAIVIGFLALFVIAGTSNAVNLTDGLDGLAAGCLMFTVASLAVIAFMSNHTEIASYLNILYIEGSGEIGIYLSGFAGACLGFLWYNGYPAQVFMGDIGSLTLGGIVGVSAVLLKREILLALIGGIFVMEALSVILQVGSFKLRNKKRVFLCAPLHHHFEYKGWHETKVVVRFWIIGLLLAIIGIASLKFQ